MYSLYVTGVYMRVPWPLTFVDVERYGADSYPDHALRMVEELNGLSVQGKIISVLCGRQRESRWEKCNSVPLHYVSTSLFK